MTTVASLSHQLGAPLLSHGGARPARVARVAIRTRASKGDEAPMEVPEDAFKDENGHNVTPERKAAVALQNLFTMAATRVILDQFTGTRHRSPVYNKMVRARASTPLPLEVTRPTRERGPCRLARSISAAQPSLTGTTPSCKSTLALTSIPFPFRASTGGFPQREPPS